MTFHKVWSAILLCVYLVSCSEKDHINSNLRTGQGTLVSAVTEISGRTVKSKSVLFFVNPVTCSPCTDELLEWDITCEKQNLDCRLFVVDRRMGVINSYMNSIGLQRIETYADTALKLAPLFSYMPTKVIISEGKNVHSANLDNAISPISFLKHHE
jgi:hypothetical protein